MIGIICLIILIIFSFVLFNKANSTGATITGAFSFTPHYYQCSIIGGTNSVYKYTYGFTEKYILFSQNGIGHDSIFINSNNPYLFEINKNNCTLVSGLNVSLLKNKISSPCILLKPANKGYSTIVSYFDKAKQECSANG